MLEQSLSLGRHLPLAGGQIAPGVHIATDLIDDGIGIVLLLLRGDAFALIENHLALRSGISALLRLRNGRDELGLAPFRDNPLGGLPVIVQLPMPARALVGRVQDGVVEEGIGHGG